MKCHQCNNAFSPGEQFCGNCGAPRQQFARPFEEAESKFHKLKVSYRNGEITDDVFQNALKDLVLQDERGAYWMIGAESENWYRYAGNDWVLADPPLAAMSPPARDVGQSPSNQVQPPQPVPEKNTAPPVPVSPISSPRRKSRAWKTCLIAFFSLSVIAVLIAVAIFIIWRLFQNEIVNFALDRGWGTVVEEPRDPSGNGVLDDEPSSSSPEDQTYLDIPRITSVERWVAFEIPDANLIIRYPDNYLHEHMIEAKTFYVHDPNPEQVLSLRITYGLHPYTSDSEQFLFE